jgi:hypothetical protein
MSFGYRIASLPAGALLLASALGCGGSTETEPFGTTGAGGSSTSSTAAAGGGSSTASAGGASTTTATSTTTTGSSTSTGGTTTEPFSFFVTSLRAMQEQSGSPNGFGGDFRLGETGAGAGLRGADKLCTKIAEKSMPGSGSKQWRAFLSAVSGEDGKQVNAIDRIGAGPWYDRLGRLVAANPADLLHDRPVGIDPAIKDDFPNEDGVPNHQPDPTQGEVDNHDTLTGTNNLGKLYSSTATCKDWTSALGNKATEGKPRVGHSWPRNGGGGGPGGGGGMANWMSSLDESGCAPGVNLIEMGPPQQNSTTVGSGGGYGGIYCFALKP